MAILFTDIQNIEVTAIIYQDNLVVKDFFLFFSFLSLNCLTTRKCILKSIFKENKIKNGHFVYMTFIPVLARIKDI